MLRGIFPTVIFCSEPGIRQAEESEIRDVYQAMISRRTNGSGGIAS